MQRQRRLASVGRHNARPGFDGLRFCPLGFRCGLLIGFHLARVVAFVGHRF